MAKVWLITGASSGLGAALVNAVIESGDFVVAGFRNGDAAAGFSKQNNQKGVGIVMDVTNTAQVMAGIKLVVDTYGTIDVLVNNAGYGTIGAIEEFGMAEIRAQMETNFFGMAAVTAQVLPIMR